MRRLVFIVLFALAQLGYSQQYEIDIENFAENLFSVQDEDVNYEDIYESLLLYYTSPINLNKTTREELASLYILSPIQIESFFNHIEQHGALISIYELQSIPYFDLGTIRSLLPFVTVNERIDNRSFWERAQDAQNNYFLIRYTRALEKEEGYTKKEGSRYLGDPNSIYGRYRISRSHDFSAGFTFEKDAGESLQWNKTSKGFDYYSAHIALMDKGIFKNITVGDYQMQFGQGLVFGSGFGSGKGSETINTVKRSSTGIRPYASALESGFFRGAATTVQIEDFHVSAFYSRLRQDANLINDTTYSDFDEFINSIQSTGFHRTENEVGAKNQITEHSAGGALEYKFTERFKIGSTFLHSHFSRPLQKKPNNYNQFEFSGDQNQIGSFYSTYVWQNTITFGEIAKSRSGGNGMTVGFISSLTPKIDMSMVLRNYDKNFHTFYGNAFGENSRLINEQGVYWGLKFQPNRRHLVVAYYDKFSFPWLKYRTESPSDGYEYLGRYTYQPSRSISLYAQFRQENKQLTQSTNDSNLNSLVDAIKRNYVFNADYKMGLDWSFKTRLQTSTYELADQKTKGYALIQDLNYKLKKLRISTRVAVFDTDFANRQYVYEKNVLYAFSIPAYNGSGTRNYLLLQYSATKALTCWIRYSQFRYYNEKSVGTGISEVDTNTRSSVIVMLRYKL